MTYIWAALGLIGTGIVSIALVIAISLGIGWILTLILPFSLFENTLLGMFASLTTWIIWNHIFERAASQDKDEDEDWDEDEDDFEAEEIPQSRFWRTNTERTWENWFRFVIANATYESLRYLVGLGNENQRQEVSIHLSDAAIRALKANPPQARRMTISRRRLKQEMLRQGQQPPENPILAVAASTINIELMHMKNELHEVARNHLWEEPADTEA